MVVLISELRGLPRRALAWWILVVVPACVLPYLLGAVPSRSELALAGLLVAFAGVSAELGRVAEGGAVVLRQRPHKALSAWPFAAALVLPVSVLPVLVALAYGWTRVRGVRVRLDKWVLSAAALVLSGTAAASMLSALGGRLEPGPVVAAGATYLAVETAVLLVTSRLGREADEVWLRTQLRQPSFHLTEIAVLAAGASIAVLWSASPLFSLLVAPMLGALQRAVLIAPLRAQAALDDKTGLLTYGTWRTVADRELARADGAVLFADLDHFKAVNDGHGHLVGDEVLAEVSRRMLTVLRGRDLAGRFGGEEFCILLPQTDAETAAKVADRLRDSVRGMRVRDVRLTLSVGVAVRNVDASPGLDALLAGADRAVYAAKQAGRDRTVIERVTDHIITPH